MIKAALYLRVSSERQSKEGDSIPAQREALRKYAKEREYIIAGEYIDDGVSGTKADREAAGKDRQAQGAVYKRPDLPGRIQSRQGEAHSPD